MIDARYTPDSSLSISILDLKCEESINQIKDIHDFLREYNVKYNYDRLIIKVDGVWQHEIDYSIEYNIQDFRIHSFRRPITNLVNLSISKCIYEDDMWDICYIVLGDKRYTYKESMLGVISALKNPMDNKTYMKFCNDKNQSL